jgi:IPT/TIG domain-containing protein
MSVLALPQPRCQEMSNREAHPISAAMKAFLALITLVLLASVPAPAQNVYTVAGGGGTPNPATNICLSAAFGGIYQSNYYIRSCEQVYMITPQGQRTLIAGAGGLPGFSGDGGPATSATFLGISDIFVDGSGNVFIVDNGNERIREVSAATGIINTVAGNGSAGYNGDGIAATSAELSNPQGIFVDGSGNLFIADEGNQRIREVSGGIITTVAGNGSAGYNGDGVAPTSAELFNPEGVFVQGSNIFIADTSNNRIREVTGGAISGVINTVAGTTGANFSGDGGPATSAHLNNPQRVFVDGSGNIYIVDDGNQRIRKVTSGIINTVAGDGILSYTGNGGPATSAGIANPLDIFVDGSGNIFLSDISGIREVLHTSGTIQTLFGNSALGYSGDNGPATSAQMFDSTGVAVDPFGNIFSADNGNYRIREIVASTGIIQTVVGTGVPGFSGDNGPAASAQISSVDGLAFDSSGNLFIADVGNRRVREVVAATGNIQTVAGNGSGVFSGDGGAATSAGLGNPFGVYVDALGRLFIATNNTERVRMVSAGIITTVAGNGTAGFSGDGGPATSAELNNPQGVFVDGSGNIFIAENGNFRIREVVAATGNIQTFAGNGSNIFSGDGGPATSAGIVTAGVSGDSSGDIFIAGGNRVREVTGGTIQTVAGVGYPGFGGDGGLATSALFDGSNFIALNPGGSRNYLVVNDSANGRIRFVGSQNPAPTLTGISPISTTVGNGVTLVVTGTNFVPGAVVFGSGSALTTTFVSATELTAAVPSNANAGVYSVTAANPIPGGGATSAAIFTVYSTNPVPAVSSLSPSVATAGGTSFTLTVTGTNFAAGAVVKFNGASRTTTVVSSTEVLAAITAPDISTAGPYGVTVTNPSPGGGTSGASTFTVNPVGATPAFLFVPVTPCRIADTRNANGSFGGPALASGSTRSFPIPSSSCGIPSTAAAYSLNVTVVPNGALGYISMWPTGQAQPLVSTLNSLDGRIKSDAAIVPAGTGGAVSVFATDATNVILDINGYFVPTTVSTALAFYPVTPCRVADTRNATGALGGPSLVGTQVRSFPVLSACSIPSSAQAYSLNFTAIPQGTLGYLSVWPAGQAQPLVSTLNALTGTVTANAAIVPAGTGGAVNLFVTNNADMVIDINGYFAPPGAGGLSLYTLTPCRVLDSRQNGAPFSGVLNVNVTASGCGVPGSAQAYVFNATVVPPASLGYLTLWPQGAAQPLVSTLNAIDGSLTSNMAIVPAASGSVSAFASNPTQLLLDISGYFAP